MFGRTPYVSLGRVDPPAPPEPEKRAITLADFPQLASFLAPMQSAGVAVTEYTALNYSAWWNGVDIISSQVAVRPRILYRRLDDDSRERAKTHQVYRLLHDEPNEYMTPFVFWQTMMYHVLTWGNGYAEIEFDNADRPMALWPIMPGTLTPKVINRELKYVQPNGGPTLKAEEVLHFPGLGYDGICGYSVLQMARASMGLSIAAERYGAGFFGNGAWPGLVLQHPGKLDDDQLARVKASLNQEHQGAGQAHKAMIIEQGMTVEKVGIPPEDAQFLGTREFQIEEMARWFNLPPHKLKHKSGERPGGNIETEQLEFETDTLLPWFVRMEQEATRKLIPRSQRSTFYVEHLMDARSRAIPTAARYQAYGLGRQWGFLSSNDIRRSENMNDIGPEGDRYLEPVNMVQAGEEKPAPAAPAPPAPAAPPEK
jgi:HK97 family phage portal protein